MTEPTAVPPGPTPADVTCPHQARPAKAAGEQLLRLKQRLIQKHINPLFALVVFAIDCEHDKKNVYHADVVGTAMNGVSAEGRTIVISALEKTLESWKAARD